MTFWVTFWVALSCLGYVVFSVKGWQHIKTLKHFFLYDGKLNPPGFWGTMVATNAAVANGFFLYIVLGYYKGWGAFFWSTVFWILGILVFQIFSKRLGPHYSNLVTLNEFLGSKAISNMQAVRNSIAVITVISFVLTLSMELVVGSQIFFSLLAPNIEIPKAIQIFVPVLLVIPVALYLSAGGFPSVVRSDMMQVACFVPGLVVCAIIAWPSAMTAARQTTASQLFMLHDWQFIVFSCYSWGIWFLVAMDMWQRCAATGSSTKPRKPAWLSLLFLIPFTAIAVGCGIYVRQFPGGVGDRPVSQAFMEMLVWHSNLPTAAIAAVFVALVAAILSTVDTFLMVVGHSIFADIILPGRGIDFKTVSAEKEPKLLFQARLLLLGLPVLCALGFSFVVYVAKANVLAMNYISYSIPCAFFPLVVLALFQEKISAKGAMVGAAVGMVTAMAFCITLTLQISAGKNVEENYNWLYATPGIASFFSLAGYSFFDFASVKGLFTHSLICILKWVEKKSERK